MAETRMDPPSRLQGPTPSTRIVEDDVLADLLAEEDRLPRDKVGLDDYLDLLWEANPEIHGLIRSSPSLPEARNRLLAYLERTERQVFALDNRAHILEKATVRDAIRVMKSILGPINEKRTGFSALDALWKLAVGREDELAEPITPGFLLELIHLLRAVGGNSNIYREREGAPKGVPEFLRLTGREAAESRSVMLDELGRRVRRGFARYPSGLDPEVVAQRRRNRERILEYFGGSEDDWQDYHWHLHHIVRDAATLDGLIELPEALRDAVGRAASSRVPFGITPYYLSLMDEEATGGLDRAVRAQVIPPPDYVAEMVRHKLDRGQVFDFMGEHDTSPVDHVTRRYPMIAILKPYNTCAQICVYCQRNWEIDEAMAPGALIRPDAQQRAIEWIAEHPALGDILITGGDPGVMSDQAIDRLLGGLAEIDHVYRIRFATRTPVVLPFRLTPGLADVLARHHEPGRREVAVVTHVEHPYEITPELVDAVTRLRRRGLGVYNQQVFTFYNSRRFETAKLRHDLRLAGIDPYYTFNMKGKRETASFMVPIARLLQERKEEARLLPGLDRTDEPVFNVPRLGKNHLRAFQDHRLVMILADGSRVYELHPWEKNIAPMPPYNYIDTPIHGYLERLAAAGEDLRDYRTIWFYY